MCAQIEKSKENKDLRLGRTITETANLKQNYNASDTGTLSPLQSKMVVLQYKMDIRNHNSSCPCPSCTVGQLSNKMTLQLKCGICGAKSHSTSNCPKNEKEEKEPEEKGRGLTKGGEKQLEMLDVLITKLEKDTTGIYGAGSKSLIGGFKGKPSGLKDISARIDRQGEGNLQFQIGKNSYAAVTFSQETEPGLIIAGLRASFKSGKIEHL